MADLVAVLAFVAIGRRSHDEGSAILGTLEVAAPFAIAAAIGWLVGRVWRSPFDPVTGVVVWIVTIAVGMPLRRLVFDRGTAVSFVVVASIVTLVFVVGWRLVVRVLAGRRRRDQIP